MCEKEPWNDIPGFCWLHFWHPCFLTSICWDKPNLLNSWTYFECICCSQQRSALQAASELWNKVYLPMWMTPTETYASPCLFPVEVESVKWVGDGIYLAATGEGKAHGMDRLKSECALQCEECGFVVLCPSNVVFVPFSTSVLSFSPTTSPAERTSRWRRQCTRRLRTNRLGIMKNHGDDHIIIKIVDTSVLHSDV